LSYPSNNRGGGYGGNSRRSGSSYRGGKGRFNPLSKAKEMFSKRSERSQRQDLQRIATLAPNIEVYLEHPERYDLPGVDMPESQQYMFDSLCQATCKSESKTCDLTIKDASAKTEKRIRLVKAENKKAELAKVEAEEEAKAKKLGRRLPTQEEIYNKAVELWRQDNGYLDNVANPDLTELREEGLLNRAKVELMTSTSGEGEKALGGYIDKVRNELLTLGFDVVPISGAAPDMSMIEGKWSDYLATQ